MVEHHKAYVGVQLMAQPLILLFKRFMEHIQFLVQVLKNEFHDFLNKKLRVNVQQLVKFFLLNAIESTKEDCIACFLVFDQGHFSVFDHFKHHVDVVDEAFGTWFKLHISVLLVKRQFPLEVAAYEVQ